MRKQLKRTVSIILTLIMLCTAVPMTAFAATHSHPGFNSEGWSVWNGKTTLYEGYYYLEDDIELSRTVNISNNAYVRLCLNGHTITCEDTAFSVYSYNSLHILDCVGTGKIETDCKTESYYPSTIINNGSLSISGGTILNSNTLTGSAVYTCANASTSVTGGRIESLSSTGLYKDVGSTVYVYGGEVHGGNCAISGHGDYSGKVGSLVINGETFTSDGYSCMNVANGNVTITDGIINGSVSFYDTAGTTTISGGTINGDLDLENKKITITDGEINAERITLNGNVNISGGKFKCADGYYHTNFMLRGSDNVISGGDFTGCKWVAIAGKTSVTGGTFNNIYVYDNSLHLSGSPVIDSVTITKSNSVSAVNPTTSANYTGSPIKMNISSDLKSGDVLVKNVSSNDVAEKFFLDENETKWKYTELKDNNLVLNILPNGQCGDYAYWGLKNGTLTIYGTGALWTNLSGNRYPWGAYTDEITNIVVEDGITSIPEYTFEYCENVKTITLPETLTSLKLNAFNDCGSLNNLLLPSSLKTVTGATDVLGFIRCESLTDVYYLGTVDEWYSMTGGKNLYSYDSSMKVNYLKFHEATRTCTQSGTDAYYRFDNISVYSNYYDENKNVVSIYTKGALGHDMGNWQTTEATCGAAGFARRDCNRCDYFESYTFGTPTGNHLYTSSIITTPATHTQYGVMTYSCECGASYTENIAKLSEHNHYASEIIYPTCSTEGYTVYTCACGDTYFDDYVDYDYNSHINEDGDMLCDYCGELAEYCSCNCHSTNSFIAFFWKILNFFQRIFGTNPVCKCGVAHY